METRFFLRFMAWERAKGELNSILQTYMDEGDKFQDFKRELEIFIEKIENLGLVEN